jgi:hypothetical protein
MDESSNAGFCSHWLVDRRAKRQTGADLFEVRAAAYNPGARTNEAGELAHCVCSECPKKFD